MALIIGSKLGTSKLNSDITSFKNRIIAVGGSISNSSLNAIDTFITTAKLNNFWDSLLEIAPYAGNELAAALVKLKYPGNIQSSLTNVGFAPGNYSETTGLTGDTSGTKYLKTGFIPSVQLTTSFNQHLSVYARNAGAVTGASPAAYLGCNSVGNFRLERNGNNVQSVLGSGAEVVAAYANNIVPGHLIGSNTAANLGYLFYRGNQVGIDTAFTTNALSTAEVSIFGSWSGSAFGRNSNLICGFHSIGTGITPTQATAFYSAVQALQTALGRQV
ncbi:hypothetical protein [Nostoc punctiforme]|uniref:Uncharacterized protein n=2 Tax=Nostoc punctiforme TaxID=272131 RepID=B2ITA3_NOSP7|nr:hypothetical protein [Nostoc punctiforme]ACC81134.1 hypothetical protein Npun_R2580 [Nostoc punctiforme PCC 73102]RCJ29181.1 hypothetical protein A6769_35900 [Nostoc punctiforme NIES-2108]